MARQCSICGQDEDLNQPANKPGAARELIDYKGKPTCHPCHDAALTFKGAK
jgi:hypothetical protein